jgi:glycosyltransferase involved in cell wall biosynthesis
MAGILSELRVISERGESMAAKISIVLATYNGSKYLAEQLESICAQTLLPAELVICDDNSSDATLQIVTEFCANAPFPVTFHRNPTALGFRDNFIGAYQLATGDWIAFCDQDDVWHPEKLEKVAAHTEGTRVTMMVHQASLIDETGRNIGSFNQGITTTKQRGTLQYNAWGTFWGFSIVVRRDVLDLVSPAHRFVDFIDPRHLIAHDRWACFLAQTLGETVEIAEPLVGYRQHASNVYGVPGKRDQPARGNFLAEQLPYIAATKSMLNIIELFPNDVEERFPAFDCMKANAFYRAALLHQQHRGLVFSKSRISSFFICLRGVITGRYRAVHDGSMQWRSLAKDLKFIFG